METIDSYLDTKPDFVKAVVGYLIKDENLILGLRKKVSNGLGENLISGIGGKVEKGEKDEEALIREIDEEICVKVLEYRDMGRVRFLFPHKPSWNQDVKIYIADEWDGEPTETEAIMPINSIEDKALTKANIPLDRMWDDNSYWLPHVLSGKRIDAFYLFDENSKVIEEKIKFL